MEQLDLLCHVVQILDRLAIPYMVVGSYGSSAWGEPRFTYDIDLVVAMSAEDVPSLVAAFPPEDYYLSADAVRHAVATGGQFNLIHPSSGFKVDFMLQRSDPWGRAQLARRRPVALAQGFTTWVAAPEDIIISKMLYYQEGGSEKHLRDITGILRVSGSAVDRAYVERWANELGLREIWQAILARLGSG